MRHRWLSISCVLVATVTAVVTAQQPPRVYTVGVNPGTNPVGNPALVAQYRRSFAFLHAAHVDVPLGSHPAMYGMAEKYAAMKAGGPNPFINPQSFTDEVTIQETAFTNELQRQMVEGPPPPRGGGPGRGGAPAPGRAPSGRN
jgi:hypothetical protein